MNNPIEYNKRFYNKLVAIALLLLVCFLYPDVSNAQNDTIFVKNDNYESALELYDSVCVYLDRGEVELAESELRRILKGVDYGEFEECSNEQVAKLLRYKSYVALTNIAIAKKRLDDLNDELLFFENVDTTYGLSVWFPNPELDSIFNDTDSVVRNYDNSAWIIYDSVCTHIKEGKTMYAEMELGWILDGFDDGLFVECTDKQAVKLLQYKSHAILANIAIADKRMEDLNQEISFFNQADSIGLVARFVDPWIDMVPEKARYVYSAWALYDSIVIQINSGEVELAKSGLRRLIDDFDKGKFVESNQEHTVRLLQYKAHVVLANIAFAEKSIEDLDIEVSFFENADTTINEWNRARYAATHFRHKGYQLINGCFGKVVGDWVSTMQNSQGVPMVWIQFTVSNNMLFAELKECAIKSCLNHDKYPNVTDKIAVDNVQNVIEVNFGDSKLMPGLQILPSVAIDMVHDASNMLSESIVRQSIAKYGTPYSSDAVLQQLGVDAAVVVASLLISQLSVTKETVTSESFVMEQICPNYYMARIKFRSITYSSNGGVEEGFQWAEIPMIHLYPDEQRDFSNVYFQESLFSAVDLLKDELSWEGSNENDEMSMGIVEDIVYSNKGIINVENTSFKPPFFFLGKNINKEVKSNCFVTSFSGLAHVNSLWGFKEEPINPMTNKSTSNLYITPLRGTFKTVISFNEYITFTGDWNSEENCGNGLLSYFNTDFPEYSFTYEGTIWKGYPHGLGIWHGFNYRYVGWFYKGKKFGYGTVLYDDGREEQGFVTKRGVIISETKVTDAMKKEFNDKVNKISEHKYQVLNE